MWFFKSPMRASLHRCTPLIWCRQTAAELERFQIKSCIVGDGFTEPCLTAREGTNFEVETVMVKQFYLVAAGVVTSLSSGSYHKCP